MLRGLFDQQAMDQRRRAIAVREQGTIFRSEHSCPWAGPTPAGSWPDRSLPAERGIFKPKAGTGPFRGSEPRFLGRMRLALGGAGLAQQMALPGQRMADDQV